MKFKPFRVLRILTFTLIIFFIQEPANSLELDKAKCGKKCKMESNLKACKVFTKEFSKWSKIENNYRSRLINGETAKAQIKGLTKLIPGVTGGTPKKANAELKVVNNELYFWMDKWGWSLTPYNVTYDNNAINEIMKRVDLHVIYCAPIYDYFE
jgi:hypothetical protein